MSVDLKKFKSSLENVRDSFRVGSWNEELKKLRENGSNCCLNEGFKKLNEELSGD